MGTYSVVVEGHTGAALAIRNWVHRDTIEHTSSRRIPDTGMRSSKTRLANAAGIFYKNQSVLVMDESSTLLDDLI